MKPRIVIIHGNCGGTGQDQWIPWLAAQLERRGYEVATPTMPDNHEAKSSVWLPYMRDTLAIGEDTIVVGWSSGGVAAMRYAEMHRLWGSVLVGVCHTDLGDELEHISGYYDRPWDWSAIRAHQRAIAQFASVDDPCVPVEEARHIHDMLGSEYHEYGDREHFGYPSPMPEFPELLEAVERIAFLGTPEAR